MRAPGKFTVPLVAAIMAASAALVPMAASARTVAGANPGADSYFATDAYPGFDGLDDLPVPEKKETSWFLHVSRDTPAEQFAYAKDEEALGNLRTARRAYDALVREWPASPEAPKAQLSMAFLMAVKEKNLEDGFEELEYMLDFYPSHCNYEKVVAFGYKLANEIYDSRKTFLGFTFTSTRVVRQRYESIVRRAPGALYVPEAMLKIAALREEDNQLEEAISVYGLIASKYPGTQEAEASVYLQAKARMALCRRLAYNKPRCIDSANYIKMVLKRDPGRPHAAEMEEWRRELLTHLSEEAWADAKFYDSRQRTAHAAVSAYERFIVEHPESAHAEEARRRIAEITAAAAERQAKERK